jgi:hypothetical protein
LIVSHKFGKFLLIPIAISVQKFKVFNLYQIFFEKTCFLIESMALLHLVITYKSNKGRTIWLFSLAFKGVTIQSFKQISVKSDSKFKIQIQISPLKTVKLFKHISIKISLGLPKKHVKHNRFRPPIPPRIVYVNLIRKLIIIIMFSDAHKTKWTSNILACIFVISSDSHIFIFLTGNIDDLFKLLDE